MTKVAKALLSLGCEGWRPVELSVRSIAQAARVEYEEARATLKTLANRGWIRRQAVGGTTFYSLGGKAPTWFRKGWRKIMEPNAPTHLDALIAASFRAEAHAKEIAKLAKQVREPKGPTEHQIAQEALHWKDTLESELDAMIGHAARHCRLNGQGDLVDEASAKAEDAEARAEPEAEDEDAEVIDAVAEPVGEDEDGAGPLALDWQEPEGDAETE